MAGSTLDELLREMEKDKDKEAAGLPPAPQSAGLKDIASHETSHMGGSSPSLMIDDPSGVPQLSHEMMGNRTDISERLASTNASPLSSRQRHLPRISYRMMGSLVAVLVLMVGLGSAVFLSQQPQDVRQRAFEGTAVVSPAPGRNTTATNTTPVPASSISPVASPIVSPVPQVNSTTWWLSPIVIIGATILIAAAIFLTVFFHWLFGL